jgi:hypothetical protein
MCASTHQSVRVRYPEAEQVHLQLKGKTAPVLGFRLRLGV